jgi:hypothetical protein
VGQNVISLELSLHSSVSHNCLLKGSLHFDDMSGFSAGVELLQELARVVVNKVFFEQGDYSSVFVEQDFGYPFIEVELFPDHARLRGR